MGENAVQSKSTPPTARRRRSQLRSGEMRRRRQIAAEEEVAEAEQEQLPGDLHEKKDGTYKMTHFRWSNPPASKHYGSFMKNWDERSQRPLITLFKNIINKDGQEQERQQ